MAEETTPEPRRRRDDAVTMTGLLKWGGAAVGVAGFLVVCGTTYARQVDRIDTLEKDVAAIKTSRTGDGAHFDELNKRFDRFERRIELFICATNKNACEERLAKSGPEDQ